METKYTVDSKVLIDKIEQVREEVKGKEYSYFGKELWGGAGVAVIDLNEDYDEECDPYENDIVVQSSNREAISWTFFKVWDIFSRENAVDYMSKYELLGRLANAVNAAEMKDDKYYEPINIINVILDEALDIAKHGYIYT